MSKTKGALFIVTGSRGVDLAPLRDTLKKDWDKNVIRPPFPSKAFTSETDENKDDLYGYDTPESFLREYTCFRVLSIDKDNPSWGLNPSVLGYLDGNGDVWVPIDLRGAKSVYRQLKEKNFNTSADKGKNWYYVIFQKDKNGKIDLDTDPEYDFAEFNQSIKYAAELPEGIYPDPKVNATAFILDNPPTEEQMDTLREFITDSSMVSFGIKALDVGETFPPERTQPPGGGASNNSGN